VKFYFLLFPISYPFYKIRCLDFLDEPHTPFEFCLLLIKLSLGINEISDGDDFDLRRMVVTMRLLLQHGADVTIQMSGHSIPDFLATQDLIDDDFLVLHLLLMTLMNLP